MKTIHTGWLLLVYYTAKALLYIPLFIAGYCYGMYSDWFDEGFDAAERDNTTVNKRIECYYE